MDATDNVGKHESRGDSTNHVGADAGVPNPPSFGELGWETPHLPGGAKLRKLFVHPHRSPSVSVALSNSPVSPNLVAQRRLKLAPDVSPGHHHKKNQVPQGRPKQNPTSLAPVVAQAAEPAFRSSPLERRAILPPP